MSEKWKEVRFFFGLTGGALVMAFVLLGISVVVTYPFNVRSCRETWARSGMDSRFGIWEGCQIQLPDGTWVPAASYRPVKEAK